MLSLHDYCSCMYISTQWKPSGKLKSSRVNKKTIFPVNSGRRDEVSKQLSKYMSLYTLSSDISR